MTDSFPRILIVNGESVNSSTATGITLTTVLGGFPVDHLLEFCLTDGDLPARVTSFTLPKRTQVLRHLAKRFVGGAVISSHMNERIRESEQSADIKSLQSVSRLKSIVNAYLDIGPVSLNAQFLAIAREFRPDIVYTAGCNVTILRLALKVARACDCPVLLHFLDNWRQSLHQGRFMSLPRLVLKRTLRSIEHSSSAGLVVSNLMADEYSALGETQYMSLMNAVDTRRSVAPLSRKTIGCTIAYTGGLHLRRYMSLLDIQMAVARLNTEGFDCRFEIYTSQQHEHVHALFDASVVSFQPYVPHDEVFDVYSKADILVHAESFDPAVQPFIRLSISTKISEYMSSGRPILCYAPSHTALSEYIEANAAGIVASNRALLYHGLRRLVTEPDLRARLGHNGSRLAREHHSLERAHQTLSQAIAINVAQHQSRDIGASRRALRALGAASARKKSPWGRRAAR